MTHPSPVTVAELRKMLLWLRNHYDVGKRSLKSKVLDRVDVVLNDENMWANLVMGGGVAQIPLGYVSVELLNIERSVADDLRERNAKLRASAQATPKPSAWRVCWVSLNTSRTELFEDLGPATAKAKENGGCIVPLYAASFSSTEPPAQATPDRQTIAVAIANKWPGDYAEGDPITGPNAIAFATADVVIAALSSTERQTCEHGNHLETCTVCLMWRSA